MAITDQLAPRVERPAARAQSEVVNRLVLCLGIAALEALAVFSVFCLVAVTYHLVFLRQSLATFDALLYGVYGLLGASVYSAFAALAASQVLELPMSSERTFRQIVLASTTSIALMLLVAFLIGHADEFSRVSLTAAYFISIPTMFALRQALHRQIVDQIGQGALHYESIGIVGHRDAVRRFVRDEVKGQGHRIEATLHLEDMRDANGKMIPGAVADFAANLLKNGTDQIIIIGDLHELDEFAPVITELKRYALNLLFAPSLNDRTIKFIDVITFGPNNVLRFVRPPMNESSVLMKRAVDIALSTLGLLALAPLFAFVALAITLESRGPVIYRQARRGFNGQTFMIWKFRSMRVAESGYAMRQAQKHDPRITRVGQFLRSTSIDELPQLINVLRGEMSLVGPRPHAVSHDEELSRELDNYVHRHRIKPGITGWAQVNGFRGETAQFAQIEGRIDHDIYYIENWSLLFDLWILVLTVFSPMTRKNAR